MSIEFRKMRVTVSCPLCENDLEVEVSKGSPATRWEPSEPPEIERVTGCHPSCKLEGTPAEYEKFYTDVMDACVEAAHRLWDDEMERRVDQERDR